VRTIEAEYKKCQPACASLLGAAACIGVLPAFSTNGPAARQAGVAAAGRLEGGGLAGARPGGHPGAAPCFTQVAPAKLLTAGLSTCRLLMLLSRHTLTVSSNNPQSAN